MRVVLRLVGCLLAGIALGVVTAMVQTWTVRVGGMHLPVGAVAGVVTIVLMARACAWWVRSRRGAVAMALGWLGATLVMGTTSSRGDLVISGGNRQVGYLLAGSVLLAAASAFPLLPLAAPPAPAPVGAGAADPDD